MTDQRSNDDRAHHLGGRDRGCADASPRGTSRSMIVPVGYYGEPILADSYE
jgi:hypothetical protein